MGGRTGAFAGRMRDVVYLAITLGFFAVAALFVVGCARIVGPDDPSLGRDDQTGEADEESVAMAGSVKS